PWPAPGRALSRPRPRAPPPAWWRSRALGPLREEAGGAVLGAVLAGGELPEAALEGLDQGELAVDLVDRVDARDPAAHGAVVAQGDDPGAGVGDGGGLGAGDGGAGAAGEPG